MYKMQHVKGSGTPILYLGRTVLKVKPLSCYYGSLQVMNKRRRRQQQQQQQQQQYI
jgi:hypothetical protein